MRKRNPPTGDIVVRLRQLVETHSLKGVAKSTGTPSANVFRYLNGTRIPVDFCVRLAWAFNLDPAWLLFGEDKPETAQAPSEASKMAGGLLKLIQAMNAAEQLQLNALHGKHHLGVLRELNQALRQYEQLQAGLHRQSAPVMRAVLNDLRQALDSRNLTRANDLARTAEQLERLCSDQRLLLESTALRGRLKRMEWFLGDVMSLARKTMRLAMGFDDELGEREIEAVAESVFAMHLVGYGDEVERITTATLALASGEAKSSQSAMWLRAVMADRQVSKGELQEGILEFTRVRNFLAEERQKLVEGLMMPRALLFAGLVDAREAITRGPDSAEKANWVVGFASLLEDEDSLAKALAYWNRVSGDKRSAGAYFGDYGPLLLRVLRGELSARDAAVRDFAKGEANPYVKQHFNALPFLQAQVLRLAGSGKDAQRRHRDSRRAFQQATKGITPSVLWHARYHRNALELGTKTEQKQAREFFRKHVELGYGAFSRFLDL